MLQHTVLINRNMNKVPNPNLKLNYVRGVAMIIIQEVVAQLKGNNVELISKVNTDVVSSVVLRGIHSLGIVKNLSVKLIQTLLVVSS